MSRGIHPRRRLPALAAVLAAALATDAAAQSRPTLQSLQPPNQGALPPIPPNPIPNVPSGTLVAPGGAQTLQAPLLLPSSLPPQTAPGQSAPAVRANEGVLQTMARFGQNAPAITGGLQWRVFADKPDQAGVFRMIKEDRSAYPTFVLPNGRYIVHVALGLASAAKAVQLRNDTVREVFELPAGGLVLKGQVGDARIPNPQIAFDVFPGSQFDQGEKRPIVSNVVTGDVVLLPEGTYYIVSKYGDGNAVVRSDIRVQAGKLTDVTVTHRAAAIMFKLVPRKGGEALANTDWAVLSPAGDAINESKGAFPRMILAEGEYKVIARNEGRTYQQDIKVITGVDGEIEVLAR